METILIKALQLILSLSLLVLLHEAGHFFFARLFKVRVEKFCLFFDPWFTLFKFKPKKSDTTYALGWLPLGGYVKIAGMIDESMDTEQMKKPEQPWEFRTKPAWQRLLIMLGGVLVNFVLALGIYSLVLFAWGDSYLPMQKMTMGFQFNEQAKALGFKDGDIPLRSNKEKFVRFDTATLYRSICNHKTITVLRNDVEVTITMPEESVNLLDIVKTEPPFATPIIPSLIDSVIVGGPAHTAGLQKGDRIVAINETAIKTVADISKLLYPVRDVLSVGCTAEDSLRLRTLSVVYDRAGIMDTTQVILTEQLQFNLHYHNLLNYYDVETKTFNFWESIPAGVEHGINVLSGYVRDMKYIFTSEGAKSVGGFASIGNFFPSTWDWPRFWELTAFLSIILAFMNILPIPALDGGHVLFLLYEIVARRKPNDKFMERAQVVGMVLLLLLLFWANINDMLRFLF